MRAVVVLHGDWLDLACETLFFLTRIFCYCSAHRFSVFEQALFLWIVRVINTSLGKGEESLPFIGVLDIFGG